MATVKHRVKCTDGRYDEGMWTFMVRRWDGLLVRLRLLVLSVAVIVMRTKLVLRYWLWHHQHPNPYAPVIDIRGRVKCWNGLYQDDPSKRPTYVFATNSVVFRGSHLAPRPRG
jgi:hypothetical protein